MATFAELLPVFARAAAHVRPGNELVCDAENEPALRNLLSWAIAHPSFFGDPGKALMLMGHYGTGKSWMMEALQRCLQGDPLFFQIYTAREVVTAYNTEGDGGLKPYRQARHMLFDDLGRERLGNFYQDKVEVMTMMIEDRYDLFVQKGIHTHFTTNLTGDDILERYGPRAHSRLKHMVNSFRVGAEVNAIDRRTSANAPERKVIEPKAIAPEASPQVAADGIAKAYRAIAEVRSTLMHVVNEAPKAKPVPQDQWEKAFQGRIERMTIKALQDMRHEVAMNNTELAAAPFLRLIDAQLLITTNQAKSKKGA